MYMLINFMYTLIYFMYTPTFLKRRKPHSLSPCFFLLVVDTSLVSALFLVLQSLAKTKILLTINNNGAG